MGADRAENEVVRCFDFTGAMEAAERAQAGRAARAARRRAGRPNPKQTSRRGRSRAWSPDCAGDASDGSAGELDQGSGADSNPKPYPSSDAQEQSNAPYGLVAEGSGREGRELGQQAHAAGRPGSHKEGESARQNDACDSDRMASVPPTQSSAGIRVVGSGLRQSEACARPLHSAGASPGGRDVVQLQGGGGAAGFVNRPLRHRDAAGAQRVSGGSGGCCHGNAPSGSGPGLGSGSGPSPPDSPRLQSRSLPGALEACLRGDRGPSGLVALGAGPGRPRLQNVQSAQASPAMGGCCAHAAGAHPRGGGAGGQHALEQPGQPRMRHPCVRRRR